jgi:large repetitive protein
MLFGNLFDLVKRGPPRRRPAPCRLAVEALDDRIVPAAMLMIGDATVFEGNAGTHTVAVTVSLTEPHGNNVSVNYATADRTATAGSDYVTVSGRLTFAKGEMSKTVLVPVIGDRVPDPEGYKDFVVQLSNPKGAKIANGQGVVAIYDDEPWIFINSVSQPEGNSGTTPLTFTVSLSSAYDLPVTVHYATADGSAKTGTDYAAASGTLVFEPGQTAQTLTVLANGDRTAAPDWYKTFSVNLSTPDSHAAISYMGVGLGTIVDDEPRISVADAYNFGETTFTFTVSLSAAYDQAVTVNFATADGTAVAGVDYLAASGTLTFAPGETTKTITVEALDPTMVAGKSFSVQFSGASTNTLITNEWATGYYDSYYDSGYGGDYYYDYGYYDYGWYY